MDMRHTCQKLVQRQKLLNIHFRRHLFCFSLPPLSLWSELTPEEKARGLARAIRKQTGEVRERWERLKGHVGGWHTQVERALERLQELQSSMDQLDLRLTRAEEAKATWQPVGDLLIDSLQDHIDKTMVRLPPVCLSPHRSLSLPERTLCES